MTRVCEGRVVTFYSYKGGVGRTFALADVAVRLARNGYRVLATDWDLEAPGLNRYFSVTPSAGVLEILTGGKPDEHWREAVISSGLETRGTLDLLLAGRPDSTYVDRVQALRWDALFEQGLGRRLENMRLDWARSYDFILVDSRTGVSDTGGICTIHLPDILVVLFTAAGQSVDGVADIARRAQAGQLKLPLDRARLMVVPIPTRVDATEHQLRRKWHERFVTELGGFILEWADEGVAPGDILDRLAVPYVPFWSYGEQLPALVGRDGDRVDVGESHQNIAALLAHQLSGTGRLVNNRDMWVRSAARTVPGGVYISHGPAEMLFAVALLADIRRRGQMAASTYSDGEVSIATADAVFVFVDPTGAAAQVAEIEALSATSVGLEASGVPTRRVLIVARRAEDLLRYTALQPFRATRVGDYASERAAIEAIEAFLLDGDEGALVAFEAVSSGPDSVLIELLLSLFTLVEFRRWLALHTDYVGISEDLPAGPASWAAYASLAVAALRRRGLVDPTFFKRLLAERPRRRGEIEQVRDLWLQGERKK